MSIYEKYETVIGLEVHVQLNTKSKAFCRDNATFGASPNTNISAISLGHPGTLPRLNKAHIHSAIKLGVALDCKINPVSHFVRKNYFYADLPKGYQITQDDQPICIGGKVDINVEGKTKTIRLHHIHMEEDAGKSIHDQDPVHSLIDLNRAGVPLLEIVSEPDLRSSDEVYAYISTIRKLVRYLDISDGNMEEGSIRADCNVSVRKKGETEYGIRCEIKNVNSLRFAKKAVEYEAKRQINVLEAGGKIIQCTLDFDPTTGKTSPLREKEDAHDYRYFADPDLPPVVLSNEEIEEVRLQMPELPKTLIPRFQNDFQLSEYDAIVLTDDKDTAEFFQEVIIYTKEYKAVANWLINIVKSWLNEHNSEITNLPIKPEQLAELIELVVANKVSYAAASQKIFDELITNPTLSAIKAAEKLNLIQDSNQDSIETFIDAAIEKFPDKVLEYRKGKKGVIGMFMGEVMKQSKGKINPKLANQLLKEKLEV